MRRTINIKKEEHKHQMRRGTAEGFKKGEAR
jgi:hypothetical protein